MLEFGAIQTVEFWFGAVILCVYQVGKFSELNSLDPYFARLSHIPNLRTWDIAGTRAFAWTLILFLLVSFTVYAVTCFVSPRIIAGWVQITQGGMTGPEFAKYVETIPYPLYISALFIGVAHQAVPGFAKIANVQRNLFHYWIGVPRVAVKMGDSSCAQIFARTPDREKRWAELAELVSPQWLAKMESYGDATFYKAVLDRLKLLDASDEVIQGKQSSTRETTIAIEQLVIAAAVATLRKSGVAGLTPLAAALNVIYEPEPSLFRAFLLGTLWYIFGLTILSLAIPMLSTLVKSVIPEATSWPQHVESAAVYIAAQVLPIFATVMLLVIFFPRSVYPSNSPEGAPATAPKYAAFLLLIIILETFYNFVLTFWEYGFLEEAPKASLGPFLLAWLPYHVLHTFIAVSVCFVIIRHFSDRAATSNSARIFATTLKLVTISILVSGFYALARARFQPGLGLDYVVLIISLNMTAALIAFFALLSAVTHRSAFGNQSFKRSAVVTLGT